MRNSRWILLALFAALAIAAIYVGSNPEMSARYSQAVRDAQLTTQSKDLVLGGIVLAIIAYLGWVLFARKG